jgi:hypothetical protein
MLLYDELIKHGPENLTLLAYRTNKRDTLLVSAIKYIVEQTIKYMTDYDTPVRCHLTRLGRKMTIAEHDNNLIACDLPFSCVANNVLNQPKYGLCRRPKFIIILFFRSNVSLVGYIRPVIRANLLYLYSDMFGWKGLCQM